MPQLDAGAGERLGVGAREHAETIGDLRQVTIALESVQQVLCPPGPRSEDHLVGGEGATSPVRTPGAGAHRVDAVAAEGARGDPYHGGLGVHDRAGPLGQVQVVLHQRVLGSVPASDHAFADLEAASTTRAGAAEERVVDFDARLLTAIGPEEHPDGCHPKGVLDAHLRGDLQVDPVGEGNGRIRDDAEHPLRLVVVRGELGPPVGDGRPLRVVVEGRGLRLIEGVGVVQRPPADPGAGKDQHIG